MFPYDPDGWQFTGRHVECTCQAAQTDRAVVHVEEIRALQASAVERLFRANRLIPKPEERPYIGEAGC